MRRKLDNLLAAAPDNYRGAIGNYVAIYKELEHNVLRPVLAYSRSHFAKTPLSELIPELADAVLAHGDLGIENADSD